MIRRGRAHPLGARVTPNGVNFAVFSAHATSIEVCIFDATGERELQRFALPARTGDIWHGELISHGESAGVGAGLVYALRASGPWQPEIGHRFDASRVLLDPYARKFSTTIRARPGSSMTSTTGATMQDLRMRVRTS